MDTELVLSVAESMFHANILTQKGLNILYGIRFGPYHECLYYSVLLRLTELYGERVELNGLNKVAYQRLRKSSVQSYVRFYTLKKQLSLEQVRACHQATDSAFMDSAFVDSP